MKADGFSLDDKRTEVKENDIPDIVARFHNREGEKAHRAVLPGAQGGDRRQRL